MPIIEPTNTAVKSFKGLHLYHAHFSNCSMRVRIALEEKGLSWEDHTIDLAKGEQLTQEYFGINPNAVVPTLVDDGVVIIDSADIIDHIDANYSANSLRPLGDDEALQQMYQWMYLARDNHLSIKTYMYGNGKMSHRLKRNEQQMAEYRERQTFDTALLDFHERFNSAQGFSEQDMQQATEVLDACFTKMDQRLIDNKWLAGDEFSLADITWIPQLVVLKAVNYPFENYPHLTEWKERIIRRPSFKKGVVDWMPTKMAG